ncbi:peptidyl-glycine alpha-amidating monooxygenase B-like isoform X4 [Penaeus japonicus]|uniref:peptidyl-glycine alpha-amidating monooxygenase B-like isoform X4 n=1 Tax=Penaeus japonicus TaxID=27405 RepID=UPI001C710A88|nr:peptidyl-glycine alpha-amidating monooxygenase B-like isoform X4 [Penaeus japonicus]
MFSGGRRKLKLSPLCWRARMQGLLALSWPFVGVLIGVLLSAPQALAREVVRRGEPSNASKTYLKTFTMPGVTPRQADAYLCTAMALNETIEEWVVRFDPLASANRAHHMLLFGCSDVSPDYLRLGSWDCGHHGVCIGGRIMFAWAKNAPATSLPKDVGFRIGGQTGIKYLTLQIHYASAMQEGQKDHSGLQMEVTREQQKYKAGIYLLGSGYADIPPRTEKTYADMNCIIGETGEPRDIYLFAYRTHAHKLGSVITGYMFDPDTKEYTEIAKGNPHWPQAFYPMSEVFHVSTDKILHARCTWNSTNCKTHTYIGQTSGDEMCNLYLMYYTDREHGSETGGCWSESFPAITQHLPADSDVPLPPNPELEEHAQGENLHKEQEITYNSVVEKPIENEKKAYKNSGYDYPLYADVDYVYPQRQRQPDRSWMPQISNVGSGGYRENSYQPKPKPLPYDYDNVITPGRQMPKDNIKPVLVEAPRKGKQLKFSAYRVLPNWGQKEITYGQVVAVALDSKGDVVVFHRGERRWDGSTFIQDTLRDQEHPITQPTLLHLHKDNGQIIDKWGENFFFMPHGLTLDKDDNIWVTDVGLHQVFKFPQGYGKGQPLLTLGTKFQPGNDATHFCKPTGVAVLSTGEFFVSDGYCNSRIIKYSANGEVLFQFGKQTNTLSGFGISSPPPGSFSIPHALTLAEDQGEVCVADRENGRIQCFTIEQGQFARQFQFDGWGNRLFSMSYTPALGGKLFAVNGPGLFSSKQVAAFEVDYTSGELQGAFSPNNQGMSNPHDIVVSHDGIDVYVAEIGPNKLWKFELESAIKAATKALNTSQAVKSATDVGKKLTGNSVPIKTRVPFTSRWSSAGVSTVVLGLLAVPVIVLTTLTLIIRARRSGRFHVRQLKNGSLSSSVLGIKGKHENGLNLGSLLNKHHGFEKVATEDLDHDAPDSDDSDIEEFSQVATRA